VNRVLELEAVSGECRIGIEREVGDRDRADPVEDPGPDALHRQPFRSDGIGTENLLLDVTQKSQSLGPENQNRGSRLDPVTFSGAAS
jgi:hypothetical protein